jgi:hypothetical protein
VFSQIDLHIPNFYITKPVIESLVYDGVNIKLIDNIDEIYKVDLIPFDGLCLSNFDSDFLRYLRNHENYHIAKNNPSIPLLFFHEMGFRYRKVGVGDFSMVVKACKIETLGLLLSFVVWLFLFGVICVF